MARLSIVVLSCLFMAGLAAGSSDQCEDGSPECHMEEMEASAVSLLQLSVDHTALAQADNGHCACMSYQEAYHNHGVQCGQGSELLEHFQPTHFGRVLPFMGLEFCGRFYTQRNDSYCSNAVFSAAPRQWCYVSSQCNELNGGAIVESLVPNQTLASQDHVFSFHDTGLQSTVSMKYCGAGDQALRDLSPPQLHELASTQRFDVGLFVKEAYPIASHALWSDIRAFFGTNASTTGMSSQLREVIASGVATVFDSATHHPPFAVVHGNRAYEVVLDMAYLRSAGSNLDPFLISTFNCLGCE